MSRIVDSDQTQLKLKEKGTSIPLIERSKSLLQTSVSETLLGDGMQVIFSELNRYTSSLKSFKGIDYQTFVILYNKTMIQNAKDDDKKEIGQEFKDEVLFDIE